MLDTSNKVSDNFDKLNVDEILYYSDYADFNDNYMVKQALDDNLIVVTDDWDIINHPLDITVLTDSRKIRL